MFLLKPKGPYVCVNCGFGNNSSVFKMYGHSVTYHSRSPSTAGTSTSLLSSAQHKSGMTHRLTECEQCQKPVDEYVQLDYNILFLDAILQKQSFYRHILLNCQISNKNALKMAVIFGLCEAFQRWTTLNGAVSASDQSARTPNLIASKTYFQLEVSFYLIFVCVIVENALFNFIFFSIFRLFSFSLLKYFPKSRGPTQSGAVVSLIELVLSVIICSYGKLFLIPSYLYAGELKLIVDQLILLFCLFSLWQCALVKGHFFLNRLQAFALVALTLVLHHYSLNALLFPIFRYLESLIPINENLLEDYLG